MGKTYKTRPLRLAHLEHKPNHSTQAGNTSGKRREANPSKFLTTNQSETIFQDERVVGSAKTIPRVHQDLDGVHSDTETTICGTPKTNPRSKSRCSKKANAAEKRQQVRMDIELKAVEPVHARAYGHMNRFERAMLEVTSTKKTRSIG